MLLTESKFNIGQVVKHKLSQQKVIILNKVWDFDNPDRISYKCRINDYKTEIFYEEELTETKQNDEISSYAITICSKCGKLIK